MSVRKEDDSTYTERESGGLLLLDALEAVDSMGRRKNADKRLWLARSTDLCIPAQLGEGCGYYVKVSVRRRDDPNSTR